MAGRLPKPTALKVLQGNPGKRPLNHDEPKPEKGAVMPEYFMGDPALVTEWKRQAPRLEAMGVLTKVDDDALATLCVLQTRFRTMVAADAPASALANVSKELRALWSRFGMTPADRARLKVDKPEAPKTGLAEFKTW